MKTQFILFKAFMLGFITRMFNIMVMQGYNHANELADIGTMQVPDMIKESFWAVMSARGGLNADEIGDARRNKILADFTYFHIQKVPAISANFFSGQVGTEYTNLQEFTAPLYEHRLIQRIGIWTANGAGDVRTLAYVPGLSLAGEQNGTFTINQNKNTKLDVYPNFEARFSAEQNDSGTISLLESIPWIAQESIDLQMDFENIPLANTAIGVFFSGLGAI